MVALYQKSLKESKHPGGTRYETHFNLASKIVKDKSCSHQEPKEQENNNILHVEEKIPSRDNMLIDFGSGDMFGDMTILGPLLNITLYICCNKFEL